MEELVFNFKDGKISIQIDCADWYLEDENNKREYLSSDWFYNKLNNDLEGVCIIAAIFYHDCNFKSGQDLIAKYKKEIDDFVGDCGFDTFVYAMEKFAQKATKYDNLHWW